MQGVGGEIPQIQHKGPEGPASAFQHGGGFGSLVGHGAGDEHIYPPAAVLIPVEGLAPAGGHNGQRLPEGIAAPGTDALPQVGGDGGDIRHQPVGVGENIGVDALENIVSPGGFHKKGIVDMAVAVGLGGDHRTAQVEGLQGLQCLRFMNLPHRLNLPACRGEIRMLVLYRGRAKGVNVHTKEGT